jgi:hypothetical protein
MVPTLLLTIYPLDTCLALVCDSCAEDHRASSLGRLVGAVGAAECAARKVERVTSRSLPSGLIVSIIREVRRRISLNVS